MKTAEFDYHLPSDRIAQAPVEPRDSSRLMTVDRQTGHIGHRHFRELPQLLRAGDLLVHNESRVIPARLFARKPTGGRVEILLLRQLNECAWEVLARGKRIRAGTHLALSDGPEGPPVGATAEVIEEKAHGIRVMAFDQAILPLADRIGATPLPPYIHIPLEDADRYQTVYARTPGSAAAPTAGLHFTSDLLLRLRDRGIRSAFVTLHIGLDTFRPVDEEEVEDHHMHMEHCRLTPEVARQVNEAKLAGRRVVSVGTTSVRVLESATVGGIGGGQPKADSCPWSTVRPFEGQTNLFITPGYEFRAVDVMITNFHLPRSTLLMLVGAFAGKELLDRVYGEAIREGYRFYSFGDAMLIT